MPTTLAPWRKPNYAESHLKTTFSGTRELTAETIHSDGMRWSRKNRLPRKTQKTMKVHFTVFSRNLRIFFTAAFCLILLGSP